jgi:class 3 adenylate cyclase
MAIVAEPPSGTVTFMFTDIEGSTRLAGRGSLRLDRKVVGEADYVFIAPVGMNSE